MTRRRTPLAVFAPFALGALVAAVACSKSDELPLDDGGLGAAEDEPCRRGADCQPRLVCAGSGTCQRPGEPGTGDRGQPCTDETACLYELVCTSNGTCGESGTTVLGDPCLASEQCTAGLVCSALGKCARPGEPGTKGADEACASPAECALGLVCLEAKCTMIALWPGTDCVALDEGPFRAYFEIPRGGKPLADFYRLPFPNDVRVKNGRVDVSDHPNPGTALPAEYADVPGAYLARIGEDVTGWGVNTTALLRLSADVDLDTLEILGGSPTIQFVNIDKGSPSYGYPAGITMFAAQGRTKYICHNHVTVRPNVGDPLLPGTTYALLLRKGIKSAAGVEAVQDADFKIVLGDAAPGDADEQAAWEAYAPLRAYLAAQSIDPATVLSAAVFTTMDPTAKMRRFREVVRARAAPVVSDLTLCDGAARSPCDDGKRLTHVCPTAADAAFHELQLVYKTPVFQQGTPPYAAIADGGAIAYEQGKPKVQREDDVCAALSVPRGAMPASGWPVVIFAHGTGGSYRDFIASGVAAALADVRDAAGQPLSQLAVIGIDAAMHGPRSHSDADPSTLFFNLRNPVAARDNSYQGAADKLQLVRVVEGFDVAAAASPTGEAIKLDPARIYLFAHSQGTIEGTPFAAFEPQIQALALSGAGGYLTGSLLHKTRPFNVAGAVQFVLADGRVGTNHPLLNLLQLFFEEIDTVNYGRGLLREPAPGVPAKHTFLSYGVADGYTPPLTIEALATVAGLPLLDQPAERCGDGVCGGSETCSTCAADCPNKDDCGPFALPFQRVGPPLQENVATPTGKVTAALVPYSGDGSYDDHQVLFRHPQGPQQAARFFGTAARDGAPTIP